MKVRREPGREGLRLVGPDSAHRQALERAKIGEGGNSIHRDRVKGGERRIAL